MRILGFDWDKTNRAKVESHGLSPFELEELFESGEPYVFAHPKATGRHIALGFVPDGRFVLAVFEHDRKTRWVEVVTAYESTNSGWGKRYEKAKGLGR